MKKNANIVAETTIPAVSAKHVSIVAKLVTSGTNAVPDAKIQTKSTCVSTRQLHRELKKPQADGMFKVDDKSVFVRVTVCEIPLDAVCDTGASVSCLSPKVFIRLPQKIQSSLEPSSKRLLSANQGEIKVKGKVTVEMKIASMTFRHAFLVLEASEAECLLGVDFLETQKCDPMFSEMKLHLNRDTSANLFPSNSTGSVLALPSHESSCQRNILHTLRS